MTPPEVLAVSKPSPLYQQPLGADFGVHETGRAALAAAAPRIRAIAASAELSGQRLALEIISVIAGPFRGQAGAVAGARVPLRRRS